MKKLEIIIRPERLDDLKTILNSNGAHGLMISNIMGYGSQRGHKQSGICTYRFLNSIS